MVLRVYAQEVPLSGEISLWHKNTAVHVICSLRGYKSTEQSAETFDWASVSHSLDVNLSSGSGTERTYLYDLTRLPLSYPMCACFVTGIPQHFSRVARWSQVAGLFPLTGVSLQNPFSALPQSAPTPKKVLHPFSAYT